MAASWNDWTFKFENMGCGWLITALTVTQKSLRHTHDSQHGGGATYDHDPICDAAGEEPRTDQESPRLLPSTLRYQVSPVCEEDAPTVEEDTDGTDEDIIVHTATAEDRNTSTQRGRDRQQSTPTDDHRQRAGSDVVLRQQPVLLATESHHSSFPVAQGRCAQNEAQGREARQDWRHSDVHNLICRHAAPPHSQRGTFTQS